MKLGLLDMFERDFLIGSRWGHGNIDVESSQPQHDVRFPVHRKALLDYIIATLLRGKMLNTQLYWLFW